MNRVSDFKLLQAYENPHQGPHVIPFAAHQPSTLDLMPEIIPFDLHHEGQLEPDTSPSSTAKCFKCGCRCERDSYGLCSMSLACGAVNDPNPPDEKDDEDLDTVPEPTPLVGMQIRLAPACDRRETSYDVWAVKSSVNSDYEEEFDEMQCLGNRFGTWMAAEIHAMGFAFDRSKITIAATHVIVNNECGETVRRIPLMDRAA